MCSCFDSVKELHQEVDINNLKENKGESNGELMKMSLYEELRYGEIEGFTYDAIKAGFGDIEEQFKKIVAEGSDVYDVIVDKDNCQVYSKEAVDGYILKYTWLIPYPPEKFKEFMDRTELRKTWDANIDVIQILGSYNEKESIMYTKYKKFLTFDPRETLAYTKTVKIGENIADITFSVESEKYPVQNNVVRVKLFVAGMFIEKVEDDLMGNATRVTCLSHMDVGLPKNLNNIARKFAGTTIPPITKKIGLQLKKYIENQSGV